MIRAIIFDWGRTLYDSEGGALFPGVPELLAGLSRRYALAIVSLVSGDFDVRAAQRRAVLHEAGLERYFAALGFVPSDKDRAYEEVLATLGVRPDEITIVDDRAWRGIAWGNRHGATTIWLRRGRFADELPDATAGMPTYTIGDIIEVARLL
jgi:FMN phosphatase YigB (HAD superfamily)